MSFLSVLVLSACGDGTGNAQDSIEMLGAMSSASVNLPADVVSRHGLIVFSFTDSKSFSNAGLPNGYFDAYADFTIYEKPMSREFIDYKFSNGVPDSCVVEVDGVSKNDSSNITDVSNFSILSDMVSAGSVLTITSPVGSWAELELFTEGADNYYLLQEDAHFLGKPPQDATVTVPGEVFPGFASIAIPYSPIIEDASLNNMVGNVLSPETDLTWDALNASDGVVLLEITADGIDPQGNATSIISVSCVFLDDGQFSFPSNVDTLLSMQDVSVSQYRLSRLFEKTTLSDESAVSVVNSASVIVEY